MDSGVCTLLQWNLKPLSLDAQHSFQSKFKYTAKYSTAAITKMLSNQKTRFSDSKNNFSMDIKHRQHAFLTLTKHSSC